MTLNQGTLLGATFYFQSFSFFLNCFQHPKLTSLSLALSLTYQLTHSLLALLNPPHTHARTNADYTNSKTEVFFSKPPFRQKILSSPVLCLKLDPSNYSCPYLLMFLPDGLKISWKSKIKTFLKTSGRRWSGITLGYMRGMSLNTPNALLLVFYESLKLYLCTKITKVQKLMLS